MPNYGTETLPEVGKLQDFLKENDIPVDLERGEGLESIYLYQRGENGETQMIRMFPDEEAVTDEEARERLDKFQSALRGENGAEIFVFKQGEEYPRRLEQKEEGYALDESVDKIPAKKEPSWLKQLLNRWFGWWQKEIDDWKRSADAEEKREALQREEILPKQREYEARRERELNNGEKPYAEVCRQVGEKLDAIYREVEKAGRDREVYRGRLISIDGVTAESILYEEYLKENVSPENQSKLFEDGARSKNGMNFRTYLKEHPDRINEIVASACIEGRSVQYIRPELGDDTISYLTDEIAQPKLTGEERQALLRCAKSRAGKIPPTASAEEKHRRIDETAELMCQNRNFDVMGMAKTLAPCNFVTFFGEDRLESDEIHLKVSDIPNPYKMTFSRAGFMDLAIVEMLRANYSPEQIFDPNALKEEKRRIGLATIEKAKTLKGKDFTKWIVDCNLEGREKLGEFVEKMMKEIDFDDPKSLCSKKALMAKFAVDCAFDMDQDYKDLKGSKECMSYLVEKLGSKEKVEERRARDHVVVNLMGGSLQGVIRSRGFALNAALGGVKRDDSGNIATLIGGEFTRQDIRDWKQRNPDKAMREIYPSLSEARGLTVPGLLQSLVVSSDPSGKELRKLVRFKKKEDVQEYARKLLRGDIEKNYSFQTDPKTQMVTLVAREGPKAEAGQPQNTVQPEQQNVFNK